MVLLDIIIDPNDTFFRKHVEPDTVIPADTTDTVASTVNMIGRQLADAAPIPPKGLVGDDVSMLLWTIFVVLVALSLCFYFVRRYRKVN